MSESGHLIHNLVLFSRLLRGLGLDVDPGRVIDLVHALRHIDLKRKEDFYHSTRSLLVHHREDLELFDQAFEAFWRDPDKAWLRFESKMAGPMRRRQKPLIVPPPLVPEAVQSETPGGSQAGLEDEPPVLEATLTYSAREVLRRKDFAELTYPEMEAIRALIDALVFDLGQRRARRMRPGSGPRLDLRRTLRRNLRFGGEVLDWARRQRKLKPRPLVVIADISGSMERYTRLLLHFIYSLTSGLDRKVESFVFSTRLTRITRELRLGLRGEEVDQVIRQVARLVPDWSGGTRIGEALKTFNFDWGRRVLGQGAVVLLISDGWDRGEVDLLRAEISRLQRSCFRLIWLNPLLGSEAYEPLARGMQTCLPYIDDFLPVHNLASLEALAKHLHSLEERPRLARRQPHAQSEPAGG